MTMLQAPETSAPAPAPEKGGKVGGGLLDPRQLVRSLPEALRKLNPATLWRNPVMLIVEVGAAFTTVLALTDPSFFAWAIAVWLWLTVVFANLAEAVAEGRGKAQAATLRAAKRDTMARRLPDPADPGRRETVGAPNSGRATMSSSRPARSSRATATWSRASPAWTSRPSPGSPHR